MVEKQNKDKTEIQTPSSEIKRAVNPHGHSYCGFQWLAPDFRLRRPQKACGCPGWEASALLGLGYWHRESGKEELKQRTT